MGLIFYGHCSNGNSDNDIRFNWRCDCKLVCKKLRIDGAADSIPLTGGHLGGIRLREHPNEYLVKLDGGVTLSPHLAGMLVRVPASSLEVDR
jgi:hypothetical protein